MNESTHHTQSTKCPGCQTEEDAWQWCELVASAALDLGDPDAIETLGSVVAHWLEVLQGDRAL